MDKYIAISVVCIPITHYIPNQIMQVNVQ